MIDLFLINLITLQQDGKIWNSIHRLKFLLIEADVKSCFAPHGPVSPDEFTKHGSSDNIYGFSVFPIAFVITRV